MPLMSSRRSAWATGDSTNTGVPQIQEAAVMISGFGPEIETLKTRTRPKKMKFIASNGETCIFLLKAKTYLIMAAPPWNYDLSNQSYVNALQM